MKAVSDFSTLEREQRGLFHTKYQMKNIKNIEQFNVLLNIIVEKIPNVPDDIIDNSKFIFQLSQLNNNIFILRGDAGTHADKIRTLLERAKTNSGYNLCSFINVLAFIYYPVLDNCRRLPRSNNKNQLVKTITDIILDKDILAYVTSRWDARFHFISFYEKLAQLIYRYSDLDTVIDLYNSPDVPLFAKYGIASVLYYKHLDLLWPLLKTIFNDENIINNTNPKFLLFILYLISKSIHVGNSSKHIVGPYIELIHRVISKIYDNIIEDEQCYCYLSNFVSCLFHLVKDKKDILEYVLGLEADYDGCIINDKALVNTFVNRLIENVEIDFTKYLFIMEEQFLEKYKHNVIFKQVIKQMVNIAIQDEGDLRLCQRWDLVAEILGDDMNPIDELTDKNALDVICMVARISPKEQTAEITKGLVRRELERLIASSPEMKEKQEKTLAVNTAYVIAALHHHCCIEKIKYGIISAIELFKESGCYNNSLRQEIIDNIDKIKQEYEMSDKDVAVVGDWLQ